MNNDASLYKHHYQHFENLQMSAREFYQHLADTIRAYQYPDVTYSIEIVSVGVNFFSAKREYFTVAYKGMKFLVCAAPFGKSYFISWWFRPDDDTHGFALLQRIPLFGWFFRPRKKSLYQVDTEVMFCNSIQSIVKAAVDKVIADQGFTVPEPQTVVA